MRTVVALAIVAAACALARADISVEARRADVAPHTPRTPLGPACDAALAAAQAKFHDRLPTVDFHVRERRVTGEYHWSDMCGVWGDYSIELAPDHRAPTAWQWRATANGYSFHRRGSRRAHGWRARVIIDGDSEGYPNDDFVESFRPALDVCLASASE